MVSSRGVREGSHLRSASLVPDLRSGRRMSAEVRCSRSHGTERGAERANRPQGKFQKGRNHENRSKLQNPRLTSERSRQLASSKNKQGKGGRFWWLSMERRQLAGGVGRTSLIATTNVSASSEEARENHISQTVWRRP